MGPEFSSYEKMLKSAMEKLPKKAAEEKRFEIPEVSSFIQGNKTIIKNFSELASALRRDKRHLSKFLFKQLATPGSMEGDSLILQRKVQYSMLQKKIEDYVKEDRITFMKCEACGARSAVREI